MIEIFKPIAQVVLLIIIVISLFHWVRTGFWVPRYIHFISAFMLIVAGLLACFAYSVNDPNAGKYLYLLLGFPVSVYLIYGLYGGGLNSKEIKINDGLAIDRAMLKYEVIDIFKEHFQPYTKWNFENLLLLSARKEHHSEIKGKSGRPYLFEVSADTYEGKDDVKIVALYGRLTECKRKFYKPRSHIVFEVDKNGIIYRAGLKSETEQAASFDRE